MLVANPEVGDALTATGKKLRVAVTAAFLALLLAGTAVGDDEHFPFGPFRMYSTRNELDGQVNAARVRITTQEGELDLSIEPRSFGLRRAEIEGQIPRIVEDPDLLEHLGHAYENIHPGVRAESVELYFVITDLEGGRPVSEMEKTIATWTAP